ncbi:retrovirus-related pol polyprotein from transposon TNT 1-94, partial [Tanacetum coccineum]
MVFMAKMEKVLLDSEESSLSVEETIAEVSYYTSKSESESEYETSEYYDNSKNYGLFVDNDDDQEIFHDAIEFATQYAKLEEERYEYMIRYSALCDNDKQHRKKIAEQEILFDKMSRQLVEINNNVLRLQEKILEKETKILELEECVRKKDLKIEKCLERLNNYENKLHKIGQTRQTIHMIMPSKDNMYNSQKGIGFENPSYFCKAKDLRPSLYDESVIGLGYTPMFLTHADDALEIEKFKRARDNKIQFAYDYGNLNESSVNEKINFSDDYFQEIINLDFEKIDSPFQKTSSLKPYVSTVILEKFIIDLEDEVVNLLKKEKENLEIIESLKSKGLESSENAISESKNQSENDCQVVEKDCENLENVNLSQIVSPTLVSKMSCASNNVEHKTKSKRRKRTSSKQIDKQVDNDVLRANRNFVHFSDLDTLSSVRRPKHSSVIWKKKGLSNTSNVDLSSVLNSKVNKDVKRYSRKDLLSCNNSHHVNTRSAYACNDAMNVSCNSRMYASYGVNGLFVFDDVSIINSRVSKMPFRKKPRDSLNMRSKSNSNKYLPRTVFRWLPKMQPLVEPVAKWIPKIIQICLWINDSGCSKHMTGNRALLTNFVEKFLGTVRFGNNDFAVIAGYGDVVIGSMTVKKVYYVEGLGHNLFSVGQFCDKGLEVAFRKSTCFVRNEDGVDLLTGDRSSNLYTIALNEIASNSSACLLARASSSQSWLWHQRLSHLNFATINNLVKNNLVRGLPKMKFEKDHLCSACEQGKIHRKHHKSKMAFASNKPLYLLHMDLYGPIRVENVIFSMITRILESDIEVFVGYSKEFAAFKVYNKQTRKIHESVNVNFDEILEIPSKQFSLEPGLSNLNKTGKSSNPTISQVSKISKKDLEDLFHNFYDEYFDSSKITKSPTTNLETSNNEIPLHEGEVFHEVSKSFQEESSSSSLNDELQQSLEELMVPLTNTQSIPNNMVPNVNEASLSHNVFNEPLEDA